MMHQGWIQPIEFRECGRDKMKKAVQIGTAPLKSIKPLIVSKGGTPSDPLFNVILLRRWYDESKQYLPKDKKV